MNLEAGLEWPSVDVDFFTTATYLKPRYDLHFWLLTSIIQPGHQNGRVVISSKFWPCEQMGQPANIMPSLRTVGALKRTRSKLTTEDMSTVSFHRETSFIHTDRTRVITVAVTRLYLCFSIRLVPRRQTNLLAYIGHVSLAVNVDCLSMPDHMVVPAVQTEFLNNYNNNNNNNLLNGPLSRTTRPAGSGKTIHLFCIYVRTIRYL